MKVLTSLLILLTLKGIAQPAVNLPAGAELFYNKALPVMKPAYKTLVMQSAIALRNHPVNVDSLINAFRGNAMLTNLSQLDITALAQLVLTQNVKDAEVNMQTDMQSMQAINKMRQQQRDIPGANTAQKAKLDSIRKLQQESMNTITVSEARKLKMGQDRNAKIMNALANLVQKTGSTQDAIISHLK